MVSETLTFYLISSWRMFPFLTHISLHYAKDGNRETESAVKYWWEEGLKIKWVHRQDTGPVDGALNGDVYLELFN